MPEEIDIAHFNRNEKRPGLQDSVPGSTEIDLRAEGDNALRGDTPLIADKLGIKDTFTVNPLIEMKVRAIDEHIKDLMLRENMRDTESSYSAIFNRMAQALGAPVESLVRGGEIVKTIDSLFRQVAFANGRSSQTFLKEYSKKFSQERTTKLLGELGKTLLALK